MYDDMIKVPKKKITRKKKNEGKENEMKKEKHFLIIISENSPTRIFPLHCL